MKKFRLPDTLVIALGILLLAIILTWIVPAGEFTRQTVDGRNVVVAGSYKTVDPSPQSILSFFIALFGDLPMQRKSLPLSSLLAVPLA
jgi:uncharacterized ion transporter superfamily protein YfcC